MRNSESQDRGTCQVDGKEVDDSGDEEYKEKVVFILGDEEDSSDIGDVDENRGQENSPKEDVDLQAYFNSCQKDDKDSGLFEMQLNGTLSSLDVVVTRPVNGDILESKLPQESLEMKENHHLGKRENSNCRHPQDYGTMPDGSLCVSVSDSCIGNLQKNGKEVQTNIPNTPSHEISMEVDQGQVKTNCAISETTCTGGVATMFTKGIDALVFGKDPQESLELEVTESDDTISNEDVVFSSGNLISDGVVLNGDNMDMSFTSSVEQVHDSPIKHGEETAMEALINGSSMKDVVLLGDPMMNDGDEEGSCVEVKASDAPVMLDAPTKGLVLSASCGLLSSIGQTGTPHKLSVDPGAASLTASPAMSPRQDSTSKDTVELNSTETCDYTMNIFLEKPLGFIKDEEVLASPDQPEKNPKCGQQGEAFENNPAMNDSSRSFFLEFKKFVKGIPHTDIHVKKRQNQIQPSRFRRKSAGRIPKNCLHTEQQRFVESGTKRHRTKSMVELKGFSKKGNRTDDWVIHDDQFQGKEKTTRKLEDKIPDRELEYNLRPKRRKSFHFLQDECECCHQEAPRRKNINIRNFTQNHERVINLRREVCHLFRALFPDLEYPRRFSEETLSVEFLMDQVMDAVGEAQCRPLGFQPYGELGSDVKVVLCKTPQSCLHHLRRKVCRLLKALLPELNLTDKFDRSGAAVDTLLSEVISSNAQ